VTAVGDADAALDLDDLARRAAHGDQEALSELLRRLQHPMYRLALRFLGHPHDAQDACQEVLIRIVTHLGSFEGRSKFTTWAYTVATRTLLRTKKRFVESSVQGPEEFAALLDAGMGDVDTTNRGGGVPTAVRRDSGQLHLRDAALPAPSAARRVRARGCHRTHRRRGRRDPRVQPRGVPPASLQGPAHAALRDREQVRAGRSGQPVPMRPPARRPGSWLGTTYCWRPTPRRKCGSGSSLW
jgi:RNA polymerase sigma factor (sigma-70 family)